MADPLSIAAILALVYAGRKLSDTPVQAPAPSPVPSPAELDEERADINYERSSLQTNIFRQPGYINVPDVNKKEEVPSFGIVSPTASRYVNGAPAQNFNFDSRMYVSGLMNNLSPTEKTLVGPGLGVGADVAATGGFQQLFRVNPNNVGAYRLTTLPGRIAPGADTTGWRSGKIGEITHYAPSKTAFMPSRLPNIGGRAQGQGGAVTGQTIVESYERTKRPTNRAETTLRTDGLEYAPAKKFVPEPTSQDDPTRNKGDFNSAEFYHTDNPAPGIHSFVGGYTNTADSKLLSQKPGSFSGYTPAQLETFGIKVDDKRGNRDRMGNAGRMNVRANPLNQGGMLSSVRIDTDKGDNYKGPANGAWGQQNYLPEGYTNLNTYKGNANPTNLNVAAKQLAGNPFAHSIA